MGKDNDDIYEKIRKINQQNAVSDNYINQGTSNSFDVPTSPKKFSEHLAEYVPGFVLIAWTVLPLSLALMFADAPFIAFLCLYPLLCPFVWVAVAKWKPDKSVLTITLGIIGHILLVTSLWSILQNSGMGNNVGFDFVGLLVILVLLVFSFLGSIITIAFIGARDR